MSWLKNIQEQMLKDITTNNLKASYLNDPERISAYGHGYYNRLMGLLSDHLKILQWVMGKENFKRLARQYVDQNPPDHFNINLYGLDFALFLRDQQGKQLWIDLADVQHRLKCSSLKPNLPNVALDAFQDKKEAWWANAHIDFKPFVDLFQAHHPVHLYYEAFHNQEPVPNITNSQSMYGYLIYRKENQGHFKPIDAFEYQIIQKLMNKEPLLKALESVKKPDDVFTYFHTWQELEVIARITSP